MERIKRCPLCNGRCEIDIHINGMSEGDSSIACEAALEVEQNISCTDCVLQFSNNYTIQLNEINIPEFDSFISGWNKRVIK